MSDLTTFSDAPGTELTWEQIRKALDRDEPYRDAPIIFHPDDKGHIGLMMQVYHWFEVSGE